MKSLPVLLGAAALLAALPLAAATNSLPTSAALPLNSATTRGFSVLTFQGPAEPALANNYLRALKQVNGTLVDTNGVPVPDEAIKPGGADPAYAADALNFEKEGAQVDLVDVDQNLIATFLPQFFPGIPGTGGHSDNFTVAATGFL